MNCRIREDTIRMAYQQLAEHGMPVTGRALRRALREQYGASGKTERVFRIWREESKRLGHTRVFVQPVEAADLARKLALTERALADGIARAERAELREIAHQDHWAREIDRLRQVQALQSSQAVTVRKLQDLVLKLSRELAAERALHST